MSASDVQIYVVLLSIMLSSHQIATAWPNKHLNNCSIALSIKLTKVKTAA